MVLKESCLLFSPDHPESRESFWEKEQGSCSAGYRKHVGSPGEEATISKVQAGH